jgi:hypothetical protein
MFAPLINNPAETKFIAVAAADLVGGVPVNRNGGLITAAEDFAWASLQIDCAPAQPGGETLAASESTRKIARNFKVSHNTIARLR